MRYIRHMRSFRYISCIVAHILAHTLALALAPGGALPPQTGACRPPACGGICKHKRDNNYQRTRGQAGGATRRGVGS